MRSLLLAGTASILIGWSAAAGAATIVTFDDLVGRALVADGYGGITWGRAWTHYDELNAPYNAASNFQRIYPTGNLPSAGFAFAAPVVFSGAFFAGYPETPVDQVPNPVTFELRLSGALVHTSASLAPSATPTFLASGYAGLVDQVTVVSGVNFWVMDNVTYDRVAGAAVPAPAALGLFGLGLLGLAVVRRAV